MNNIVEELTNALKALDNLSGKTMKERHFLSVARAHIRSVILLQEMSEEKESENFPLHVEISNGLSAWKKFSAYKVRVANEPEALEFTIYAEPEQKGFSVMANRAVQILPRASNAFFLRGEE